MPNLKPAQGFREQAPANSEPVDPPKAARAEAAAEAKNREAQPGGPHVLEKRPSNVTRPVSPLEKPRAERREEM
eukprot:1075182-Prorocentrum_minimum.AAC.1